MKCYCDTNQAFSKCCEPYLLGHKYPSNPAALMRSRYSAFASGNADYLKQTWHPNHLPSDLTLDSDQKWLGLKVLDSSQDVDQGEVRFVARYKIQGKAYRLEEHSLFSCIGGRWYYLHAI